MFLFFFACGVSAIEDGWTKNGIETIKTGYVSAFYTETQSGTSILFDTGGEGDAKSIQKALETKGKTLSDIDHIFITHGHTDHVTALPLFSEAKIYAMPEEEDLMEEKINFKADQDLRDGGITQIDELEIETLWVPGHTEGNAVFLVNGILIMGDTAMASDKGTVVASPSFFNDDDAKAKEAITLLADRLEETDKAIEWMVFSHSGPLQDVEELFAYQP